MSISRNTPLPSGRIFCNELLPYFKLTLIEDFQKEILQRFGLVKDAKLKLQLSVAPEDGITKQEVDELKAALKKIGLSDKVDLSL